MDAFWFFMATIELRREWDEIVSETLLLE